jgi:poly-gamma-glutamate synthesis protein (capsule biosynthesis protein)
MRRLVALIALSALVAACGEINQTPAAEAPPILGPTVRVLLVGDVMTGRGVTAAIDTNTDEVFAGVRHLLRAADVVGANLESPLTDAPHISENENMLAADPSTAEMLAAAGFDVMALPNNHSTDAGSDGLLDTIAAVEGAGMRMVGAGATHAEAASPTIVYDELSVGFLAFDATGVGAAATGLPGIAAWDEAEAVAAVHALRSRVDVVVVSVHGGTEYLPVTDPGMLSITETLHAAGVDIA